jgi:hypothetical protein
MLSAWVSENYQTVLNTVLYRLMTPRDAPSDDHTGFDERPESEE